VTDLLTLQNTAFVLDSTCDAPAGYFDQDGLYMVPLKVHFGDEMFRDTLDMTHEEFFARLEASEVLPTTSQPTAGEFAAVYEEAGRSYEGRKGVEVYDTRTVTAAITMLTERLRSRLQAGCSIDEVRAYIERFAAHSTLLIHAATLEYLRRGGRIGRASSLVGGVFDIKPLIAKTEGTLQAYAKVRGQKKAFAAMERYIEETTKPGDEIYFALIDAVNEQELPLIRELIERVRPKARFVCYGKVGAVVGTHIGPGTAAFAMIAE